MIEKPLRKSVFRAILARLAALCNERSPGSVSVYGGQGEVLVGDNPLKLLRISFANTPDEQWLTLNPIGSGEPTNGRTP